MKILFINGSPNKEGRTSKLAKSLLSGRDYDVLNLVDYKIYSYGQNFDDDELDKILAEIKQAEIIIIGSPVYWHNLSGSVRVLLDRLYGTLNREDLHGKKLFFLFQGAAPEKWMLDAGEFTIKRFAMLYGLEYMGMATTQSEAEKLSTQI